MSDQYKPMRGTPSFRETDLDNDLNPRFVRLGTEAAKYLPPPSNMANRKPWNDPWKKEFAYLDKMNKLSDIDDDITILDLLNHPKLSDKQKLDFITEYIKRESDAPRMNIPEPVKVQNDIDDSEYIDSSRPTETTQYEEDVAGEPRTNDINQVMGIDPLDVVADKYGIVPADLKLKQSQRGNMQPEGIGDDELALPEGKEKETKTDAFWADTKKHYVAKILNEIESPDFPQRAELAALPHKDQVQWITDFIEDRLNTAENEPLPNLKENITRMASLINQVDDSAIRINEDSISLDGVKYTPNKDYTSFTTDNGEVLDGRLFSKMIAKAAIDKGVQNPADAAYYKSADKEAERLKKAGRVSRSKDEKALDSELNAELADEDANKDLEYLMNEEAKRLADAQTEDYPEPGTEEPVIPEASEAFDENFDYDKETGKLPEDDDQSNFKQKSKILKDMEEALRRGAAKTVQRKATEKQTKQAEIDAKKAEEKAAYEKSQADWIAAGKPIAEHRWSYQDIPGVEKREKHTPRKASIDIDNDGDVDKYDMAEYEKAWEEYKNRKGTSYE